MRPEMFRRVDEIARHYLIAALWTQEFDDVDVDDLPEETWGEAKRDCMIFLSRNEDLIAESGMSDDHIGHNFWLDRNGHGTGFWDRELGEAGDRLSKACDEFGETWIYMGDDGRVYFM